LGTEKAYESSALPLSYSAVLVGWKGGILAWLKCLEKIRGNRDLLKILLILVFSIGEIEMDSELEAGRVVFIGCGRF